MRASNDEGKMAKLNIVCWHLPDDFHDADHLNELGFLYIHQGQMIRRVCLQYAAIHWLRNHSETRPSFLFIQLQHLIHLDSTTVLEINVIPVLKTLETLTVKLKTVFSHSKFQIRAWFNCMNKKKKWKCGPYK